MADCSPQFIEFNIAISLTKTDKKYLRAARRGITAKVRRYFSSNEQCPRVEFKGQGSFSMGTIVRPINGEFDIDIGIYLKNQSIFRDFWPKPEKVSYWLVKALDGHTIIPPVNKRNCIRIRYQPISKNKDVAYHVDLPIYCTYRDLLGYTYTRIGITGKTRWERKSDPVGFTKWFFEKCVENASDKNQLIRLIKYIKAWKDLVKGEMKLPSGMALTVLIANNFVQHTRDDIAFVSTIEKAYSSLYGFWSSEQIISPVKPNNDLLSRLTRMQKNNFKLLFKRLVEKGKDAIETADLNQGLSIWHSEMGDRFSNKQIP